MLGRELEGDPFLLRVQPWSYVLQVPPLLSGQNLGMYFYLAARETRKCYLWANLCPDRRREKVWTGIGGQLLVFATNFGFSFLVFFPVHLALVEAIEGKGLPRRRWRGELRWGCHLFSALLRYPKQNCKTMCTTRWFDVLYTSWKVLRTGGSIFFGGSWKLNAFFSHKAWPVCFRG